VSCKQLTDLSPCHGVFHVQGLLKSGDKPAADTSYRQIDDADHADSGNSGNSCSTRASFLP
jgi:hypothetical protein